jgi:ribosome-associated protein
MKTQITGDFVELYKILKFEGLANSGGQAKLMIGDGLVSVNGDVETRKRRKIICGDNIEFDGHQIEIVSDV